MQRNESARVTQPVNIVGISASKREERQLDAKIKIQRASGYEML